ncbi:iron-siderophore ABC transporter substrate-binding protein [Mycolicibacterium arenosum]|uniref:Iron-siderophore ABC transporter substrate-binding protein n=1 Tax=Mycolicibacterium arenosum TaxID=2952157 RepID=A0ABT1M5E8_9MYCO|nr:iron-siderophore ABC transporter substrate-binding protein [Mycolicibacterium sp. CAU 1645]MCP9274388.1 iron-siderophore ABC transporter substrate-binding protein [Mycolicibacterium sp. CAU 1645]
MLPTSRRTGPVAAAIAVSIAVAVTLVSGCGDESGPATNASNAPVTSTTKIAGAGVLGNQRRPDESCAPEPAAPDPGFEQRIVRHAAGETELRGDPQRIVVLSGDQLDALCALGLQGRIVAAATPDDTDAQPSYLGTAVHDAPPAGTRSDPDLAAVTAAKPDLILGSEALTPESYRALTNIAPTVFTGPPGPEWRDTLRTVGAATGRAEAANGIVDGFERDADRTGSENDATHYQASVVQFTEDTMRVYGAADFPGSVLAAVGVDRPAAQRFTDKPYQEIGTTELDEADFSPAEGDIVYVSFSDPAAKDRAAAVLDSDAWRALSAARDNRVFIVNNEVWQTGQGVVAARGMLDDLRTLNGPVN